MDIEFIITIFLIGFIGSYISGMLGIGGSRVSLLRGADPFYVSSPN